MTALAAVQKLEGKGNIMGISMGSSEGAGYANAEGHWSAAFCSPKPTKKPWQGSHGELHQVIIGDQFHPSCIEIF